MVDLDFINENYLNREEPLRYNCVKEVNEINKTMEEIKNSDFRIKELKYEDKQIKYSELLKNAALCVRSIKELNLPYGDLPRILKLQDIMEKKYKALNPELSDEAIDALGYSHYSYDPRYYYDNKKCEKITIDAFAIEDVVFIKYGIVDKLGNVCDVDIHNIVNSYYSIFGDSYSHCFDEKPSYFDMINNDEDDLYHKMFIYHELSFLINFICRNDVTKPSFISELNNNHDLDDQFSAFSSYKRLFGLDSTEYGQAIYINAKFEDIEKSWENLEERDYKICVLNKKYYQDFNDEDITLYTVHQSFSANKSAHWKVLHENHDVWRLTEAASKIKTSNNKKILSKKNDRIKKKP